MGVKTYTVGENNEVWRQDNHDGNWVDISIPLVYEGIPFHILDVMTNPDNENHVCVVGWILGSAPDENKGIMVSYDAGATWIKPGGSWADEWYQATPNLQDGKITEVWWQDKDTIYAIGSSIDDINNRGRAGIILKSTDGGATFNATTPLPCAIFGSVNDDFRFSEAIHVNNGASPGVHTILACASKTKYAGMGQSLVYRSEDNGVTWNAGAILDATNLDPAQPPGGILGCFISDETGTRATLVGIYCPWISTDNGDTWTALPPLSNRNNEHLTWFGAQVAQADTFVICGGPHVATCESIDQGATWANTWTADAPYFIRLKAMHLYSNTEGYYSGIGQSSPLYNTLYRTANRAAHGAYVGGASPDPVVKMTAGNIEAVWTAGEPTEAPCGCPDGYTYNETTDECEKLESVSALCESGTYTVGQGNQLCATYGWRGTNFYQQVDLQTDPLPLNNDLVPTQVDDANGNSWPIINNVQDTLWGDGLPCGAAPNEVFHGRLNFCGVWVTAGFTGTNTCGNNNPNPPCDEWIGFTTCIDVPESKLYFIGLGADNECRFSVAGTMVAQFLNDDPTVFTYWHVFPVYLEAGTTVIEMEGLNTGGAAAFGAEIYDTGGSYQDLQNFTVWDDGAGGGLQSATIFTTMDLHGEIFDIGENAGCNCDGLPGTGWFLSTCDGEYTCERITTAPQLPCCCYLMTNCDDAADQILIQLDEEDPNCPLDPCAVYQIDGDIYNCWTAQPSIECVQGEEPSYNTVSAPFINCNDCKCTLYLLTQCPTSLPHGHIYIDNESYSTYLNKVIKWVDTPGTHGPAGAEYCSTVTIEECEPEFVISPEVEVLECFEDCETCTYIPPPIPLELKQRTVKPGYDTKCCPADYIKQISCNFSEAIYQEIAKERFGVEICCDKDINKWIIKKQLLDLDCLKDPNACIESTCICSWKRIINPFNDFTTIDLFTCSEQSYHKVLPPYEVVDVCVNTDMEAEFVLNGAYMVDLGETCCNPPPYVPSVSCCYEINFQVESGDNAVVHAYLCGDDHLTVIEIAGPGGPGVNKCVNICKGFHNIWLPHPDAYLEINYKLPDLEPCDETYCQSGVFDECGICDGPGLVGDECDCEGNIFDCTETCGGTAEVDDCGNCWGGTTGVPEPCIRDLCNRCCDDPEYGDPCP